MKFYSLMKFSPSKKVHEHTKDFNHSAIRPILKKLRWEWRIILLNLYFKRVQKDQINNQNHTRKLRNKTVATKTCFISQDKVIMVEFQ